MTKSKPIGNRGKAIVKKEYSSQNAGKENGGEWREHPHYSFLATHYYFEFGAFLMGQR